MSTTPDKLDKAIELWAALLPEDVIDALTIIRDSVPNDPDPEMANRLDPETVDGLSGKQQLETGLAYLDGTVWRLTESGERVVALRKGIAGKLERPMSRFDKEYE
jgi:hypothetical protein